MNNNQINDTVRQQVWDGLLEVARATHYFSAQKDRYVRERNISRYAQGIAGTGAVVNLLNFFPYAEQSAAVFGALIVFVVIWNFVRDPESKAARLTIVTSHQLPFLESRYRALWGRTMSAAISNKAAQNQKDALMAELVSIASVLNDIEHDQQLVTKTQYDAFKVEEQRYA